VSRERLLSIYCLLFASLGWLPLLLTPRPPVDFLAALLFAVLALTIDLLSFRVPPTGFYSLVGVVLLSAALALGPVNGALIAAIESLIAGLSLQIIHQRPRSFYQYVARPLLRSGSRALGILLGGWIATTTTGASLDTVALLHPLPLLLWMIIAYTLTSQLARAGRELLQGGYSGLQTWWRSTWSLVLALEIAPLPLALLGSAVYNELGMGFFLLTGISLIGTAGAVRRATVNLQSQRRSVRELALLNEVSRAIIRSELQVDALCELIYREASKILDTSTFHLGLFDNGHYTLMVRVQDRVRMPRLTVDLDEGDAGIMGWLRRTGRALLVEDFATEMERLPARPRYQSDNPPRSGIYVPLIAGDAVIGSISVQSHKARAFDANDLRLLSLIADQAAVAIARARMFHETRTRAVQLQAIHEVSERITAILNLEELLPSVVRLIRERFQYHPVHIFTIEPGSDTITFRASSAGDDYRTVIQTMPPLRIGIGVVGYAARSGEALLVGDVRKDERYIRDSRSTRSELAVPLRVGDTVIGVLDVQSDQENDFDAADLFVMQTLADQIAIAIDSANSYMAQQAEAWTLNALLQVAENVGRATTLPDLLATTVRLPPLLLGCSRCLCLLAHRSEGCYEVAATYGLSSDQRDTLAEARLCVDDIPLLYRMEQALESDPLNRIISLNDAQVHAGEFVPLIEICHSGTLVVLPIVARSNLLGVLLLDYDEPLMRLNSHQVSLCTGMAAQFASALESALLAEEADEVVRLEQELQVAREIQTTLLPARTPQIDGWQIEATWRSARLVGGDFFDFWPLPPHRSRTHDDLMLAHALGNKTSVLALDEIGAPPEVQQSVALGIVIADVSDKGIPAAMFMTMSRSLVRAAALDGSAPATAMERANRWITRDSESGMFVTLFYGLLDTASGDLRYTCAGHNPPLLYHVAEQRFEELRTPGIALGVLEEIRLSEGKTTLAPGDLLVCYTDGVTEAINEDNEDFGVERLRTLIAESHDHSADQLLREIMEQVAAFTSGQPPFDDITLVVVKRLPE
jgi:serine phosphatase RsbU (regulator of sigma subunit)/putative methionine-R-sulfoxide reductase with GAF domain